MIAVIRGNIEELKPNEVIVDVGGVGYRCTIPFSTYEKLVGEKDVKLYTITYLREDLLKLFGFHSNAEREVFSVLTGINGIGPAIALAILSGIGIIELIDAVKAGNAASLLRIPGIGKAKAEKLVFELNRKINRLEHLCTAVSSGSPVRVEAVEALTALGFDEGRSMKVVSRLMADTPEITLEDIIKKSLQLLSS